MAVFFVILVLVIIFAPALRVVGGFVAIVMLYSTFTAPESGEEAALEASGADSVEELRVEITAIENDFGEGLECEEILDIEKVDGVFEIQCSDQKRHRITIDNGAS